MKSTPRTTSLNEPDIRPARNHAEAEEIGSLLLEEIAHPGFIPGPEFVWQGQGFLRPTLIGAWSQNRLVGGASLSPYMEHTKAFLGIGRADAAKAVTRLVAETDGIAVRPDHRREGVGRKIKLFCDSFAAQHHAAIMVSVTTNEAAAGLNHEAGHIVFERCDGLVIKYVDTVGEPLIWLHDLDGMIPEAAWSVSVLGKTYGPTIVVGEQRAIRSKNTSQDNGVQWILAVDAFGSDINA
ncbi:GNAT family N-acetyltransferase [Bifidobacterium bifidum]|uniref:GNAT family N-acetyltransferase n=1 Tax=Bifidobacterium bifidum TaxID=1681 RepID=UPI002FDAB290